MELPDDFLPGTDPGKDGFEVRGVKPLLEDVPVPSDHLAQRVPFVGRVDQAPVVRRDRQQIVIDVPGRRVRFFRR